MNTSGKARSLAPFAPASEIRRMAFCVEAAASMKTGAACTTAILKAVSDMSFPWVMRAGLPRHVASHAERIHRPLARDQAPGATGRQDHRDDGKGTEANEI